MERKKHIVALLAILMLLFTGACGRTGDTMVEESFEEGSVYYLNPEPDWENEWNALAKAYTKETGIRVKIVTVNHEPYEAALTAAMAEDEVPTLFEVCGEAGLLPWKEYCYDLAESAVYEQLTDKAKSVLSDADGFVSAVSYATKSYGLIYNKKLLEQYCQTDNAVIQSAEELQNFAVLKRTVRDIQRKKEELGIKGAFASAPLNESSRWEFMADLLNVPIYYEMTVDADTSVKGRYLDGLKQLWDLYVGNGASSQVLLSGKTKQDAELEFSMGDAVFYLNGTWDYENLDNRKVADADMGILPIYMGMEGESQQGLCTGSENYWCVNRKASVVDIKATLHFLEWVTSSEQGCRQLTEGMGIEIPFSIPYGSINPQNPLMEEAKQYSVPGKFPVAWCFSDMPSEAWKNRVEAAMLQYTEGMGDWAAVEAAFSNGWEQRF